jgi:hypothetical protein
MSSQKDSENCKDVTALTKLVFSAIGMVVFIILSLPWTYTQVNKLFGASKHIIITEAGAPTLKGVAVHALVYLIIIFLIMQPWKKSKTCNE